MKEALIRVISPVIRVEVQPLDEAIADHQRRLAETERAHKTNVEEFYRRFSLGDYDAQINKSLSRDYLDARTGGTPQPVTVFVCNRTVKSYDRRLRWSSLPQSKP